MQTFQQFHSLLTSPTRILLVEDNPGDALLVEEALTKMRQAQFELTHSHSLGQGLRQMAENGIDVILLDLSLPDSQGLNTLHKTFAQAPSIPIIILTGLDDEIMAIQALEEGAQDYLMKGQINSFILVRAIQYAIERKRNEKALRHSNTELERLVLERTVELQRTNEALLVEIAERAQAQNKLQEAQTHLEVKIKERTAELATTNEALRTEIAERKELEERLVQAQKMEAIGRLAGGVAHDFNNILTAIIGFSQLLLEKFKEGDRTYQTVKEIEKAGQRAASLTSQLLAFSRKQVLLPKVINLNVIMLSLEKMLQRIIGEDIRLVLSLDQNLGQVKVDPTQIDQVIMNLAVNARDAMPQGGRLLLETANITLDEGSVQDHPEMTPGDYIMLAITDSGCGIDKENLSKVFDPFYTTKEMGRGTGLGLATVYGIVRQSNGHIRVYSEPGEGTTFKIYLPRIDEAADLLAQSNAKVVTGGKETILVTEDEDAVRKLLRITLESHGYTVLEAARGEAAVSLCNQHQEDIHLLLTDVVMPQMSGMHLGAIITRMRPDIRVVFMSGYTNTTIAHHGIVTPGAAFIEKPFDSTTLLKKIREVLDA